LAITIWFSAISASIPLNGLGVGTAVVVVVDVVVGAIVVVVVEVAGRLAGGVVVGSTTGSFEHEATISAKATTVTVLIRLMLAIRVKRVSLGRRRLKRFSRSG